jgi:hypothetical protein
MSMERTESNEMAILKIGQTNNRPSSDRSQCVVCGSSITVEMDGLWTSYRVCVRNGHRQDDAEGMAPLVGAAFYPARG